MDDQRSWTRILLDELRWHPAAKPVDLRKLVLQSARGGDHLLRDPDRFERTLRAEWDRLPPSAGIPCIQSIDPEGRTARLHLVPCRRAGLSVDDLIDGLLAQPRKAGRLEIELARWDDVISLAEGGLLPFPPPALRAWTNLPAPPHHSPAYGPAAYRILHDVTDSQTQSLLRAWRIPL